MEEDSYRYVSTGLLNVSRLLNTAEEGDICNTFSYMKMRHRQAETSIWEKRSINSNKKKLQFLE